MKVFTRALVIGLLSVATAQAQEEKTYVEPDQNCRALLTSDDNLTDVLIAAWTLGYLSSAKDASYSVDSGNIQTALDILMERCAATPEASMIALLREDTSEQAGAEVASNEPGSEQDARALLSRFLSADTDRADLTMSLRPTEEDIRSVYEDELAERLIQSYEGLFRPGVAIGPNGGQTELLTWHARTDALIAGKDILQEFPGGYKEVVPFMKPGHTIVRFKFVEPGETLGMAFDGLIYTGERWVFMPKPWRSLP